MVGCCNRRMVGGDSWDQIRIETRSQSWNITGGSDVDQRPLLRSCGCDRCCRSWWDTHDMEKLNYLRVT